jgi:hypothetical protein
VGNSALPNLGLQLTKARYEIADDVVERLGGGERRAGLRS